MNTLFGMAGATIEGLAFSSHLGGGIAPHSPFQRSLRFLVAPCLPFSDASKRPATKGAYPLGFPTTQLRSVVALRGNPALPGGEDV
jgi:hypothetical protein